MTPNIATVVDFLKEMDADTFITLDGRAVPQQSYLAENMDCHVSLKYKEPVVTLNVIKVPSDIKDIRAYVEGNESIKYYRSKGQHNWIPFTKRFPARKNICYLGEVGNLVKWNDITASESLRKSTGDTLGMHGFEKQGHCTFNYGYVEDDTVILTDDEYENYALDEDGSFQFVYKYWLRLYTFSCYEETLDFIEDNLTGNIGDIKIRYSGAGDWRRWREPSEYAEDIQQSWFKSNKDYEYDGCWDEEFRDITTRTRPKKNQIIISALADV